MRKKRGVDTRQITFVLDLAPDKPKKRREKTPYRLVWIFLALLRSGNVRYADYKRECPPGLPKSFQRDLRELREIGERTGFSISHQRDEVAYLESMKNRPDGRARAGPVAADTLQALALAFGEIVGKDIGEHIDLSATSLDPFLALALPQLIGHSDVAKVFVRLRHAWKQRARVRFRYRKPGANVHEADLEERTVEPHLVTYYDGRFYLVAYDGRPRTRAWRQFAIDRIVGEIALVGTFDPQPIPHKYRGQDAVGLFKSIAAVHVTIAFSADIAEAVIARRWQRDQRIVRQIDGSIHLILEVHDLGEAVRWALGFGSKARVLAPAAATHLAYEITTQMAADYARDIALESRLQRA